MSRYLLSVLLIFSTYHSICLSQDYFRLEADITVKINNSDGVKSLTKGKVYYDKHIKVLVYDLTFPRNEKWISRDTSLLIYSENKLVRRTSIPYIGEFTIFHLALNSQLNDYGLKKSSFSINKVEKQGELVLSYWKIPKPLNVLVDIVVVAKSGNRLESVVILGKNQEILSKQFFRDYIKIDAFEFPQQIIQILYDTSGEESYQVTEFANIRLNEMKNDRLYRFDL